LSLKEIVALRNARVKRLEDEYKRQEEERKKMERENFKKKITAK
jgi:hypothetical protein